MNMKTYYKGNFILQNNIPKEITFTLIKKEKLHVNMNITGSRYKFKDEEKNRLIKFILKQKYKSETDISRDFEQVNNIINLISNLAKKSSKISILFEKVFDKNGNIYAKELITGLVFPLFTKDDLDYNKGFRYHYHKNINEKIEGNYITTGFFEIKTELRKFVYSCDLYCTEDGIANETEINYYLNHYQNEKFKNKIRKLYNMNIFDDNIINANLSNNISNITSNNQTNNIPANSNVQQSINQTNSSNIQIKNSINTNSTLSKSPTSIRLEILENLENIKNKLNNLSDKEIALLRDMTNNNLNDPNILEYIDMPLDKKLEFLEQKTKENSSKVSLEKKKTYK